MLISFLMTFSCCLTAPAMLTPENHSCTGSVIYWDGLSSLFSLGGHCALWACNLTFVAGSRSKMCLCQPFAQPFASLLPALCPLITFSNHLNYLTRHGLPKVMNLESRYAPFLSSGGVERRCGGGSWGETDLVERFPVASHFSFGMFLFPCPSSLVHTHPHRML